MDSGGMDKHWVPPDAPQEDRERALERYREEQRERKRTDERRQRGDYTY